MIVYFVRHGGVENPNDVVYGRRRGFPLSDRGRKQVEKLADELSAKSIEVIFSSPLWRTRQTAEILSRSLKVPLLSDERLIEIDVGHFEGKPRSEYFKATAGIDRLKQVTGGEGISEAGQRVINFLEEVKSSGEYQTIAVVSHEAPIVGARLNLLGKGEKDYDSYKIPTGGCVKVNY